MFPVTALNCKLTSNGEKNWRGVANMIMIRKIVLDELEKEKRKPKKKQK